MPSPIPLGLPFISVTMRLTITFAFFLIQWLGVLGTWTAYEEYLSSIPTSQDAKRPVLSFSPNQPWEPLPTSPARHRTCNVKSHDDMHTDDSAHILDALHKCNNGGRVVFTAGTTYVIGKAINMELNHVDLGNSSQNEAVQNLRTNDIDSHSRIHSIHEQHKLLAEAQLQTDLSECNHILPARRY